MNQRIFILAVSLLIAAVAAAAALGGGSTSPTTGTTSFVLRFLGPTGFVDNPPRSPEKNGIPQHLSPGDTLLAHSLVYDSTNTKRLGRTSELCTVTVPTPLTFDCSMALIFTHGGELLVHGALNPTKPTWDAPVVGGDGPYSNAHGSVKMTGLATKQPAERWTFTLAG